MIVNRLRLVVKGKKTRKGPKKGIEFYVAGKIKRYYLAFEFSRMYLAPEKDKRKIVKFALGGSNIESSTVEKINPIH